MSRLVFTSLFVALATSAGAHAVRAQTSAIPDSQELGPVIRRHLNGPRFGFTVFTGDVADMRDQAGLEPIMTQFGWQWETQLVASRDGSQALMEWVLLVGGVEQDEFNVSLGWLTGYRFPNGLEFGVGPNVSVNKDSPDATTSMIIAVGATAPFGQLQVPVNFALSLAKGGARITALIGWIVG
jgi:hypothetical protein